MRPQRIAAENVWHSQRPIQNLDGFNEAAADRCGKHIVTALLGAGAAVLQ